ncbi:MAG TPA: hypothetical protein DDX85_05480 [Nitrospiraceae bacterium]|nr:hypothetical protein [Nitrospiraceae bacterium]
MISFEMKNNYIRKFIMPPGPILSMTLIGLLLLSALLYYRAIKIQRFLEPALAVSEPRIKFNQDINTLLMKEFGTAGNAIKFRKGSILIDQSFLFSTTHRTEGSNPLILKKLSRFFLSILSDRDIRERINLILVSTNLPFTADTKLNKELRYRVQERTALVLNSLYAVEPELEQKFGTYFAITAIPVGASGGETNLIEFRMIPTERLHIEMLERLEKYSY